MSVRAADALAAMGDMPLLSFGQLAIRGLVVVVMVTKLVMTHYFVKGPPSAAMIMGQSGPYGRVGD